jgi:hypothetical protein
MSMFYQHSDSLESDYSAADGQFELVNDDNKKKYVCKHKGCGKFFRYKSEIVRHTATHSESRPFICQYDNCFKAFKRNDALENHIRSSHTKETPFICPFTDCGMKFTTHGSFRYHVLKHNKQLPDGEGSSFTHEAPEEIMEPTKQVKLNVPQETLFMSSPESQKMDQITIKLGKERLADEFYVQPTRFASNIKWEMVNDEINEETATSQKNEETQEDKFNQVVEENKILKQKLQTSEKVIKSMQKQISDLLGNLFACQSQLNNLPANPSLESFPSFSESLFQEFQAPAVQQKMEEPLLDMINYGENNLMSPASVYNNNEGISVDSFLSFDKGFKSFDF